MANLKTWILACSVSLLCATSVLSTQAQVFTTLVNFDGGANGGFPYGGLAQGFDGNLYGTTASNTGVTGTVFKMTPEGALTTIHNFSLSDGGSSQAGLALGTDGNFYGTTIAGGQAGTIFKITPQGSLTTIYEFCVNSFCPDGATPKGRLALADDGNFYGSTVYGGDYQCGFDSGGCGTVFQLTPTATETALHVFEMTDGFWPVDGLTQSTNGDLYGVTPEGGSLNGGTAFKFTTQGQFKTIHSFDASCSIACFPNPDLVQAASGTFWGTTIDGGPQSAGTIYKMSQSGKVKTVYDFCTSPGCTDGGAPYMGLVLGTDNAFYGMTSGEHFGFSCNNSCATIFKITSKSVLTTLYTFTTELPIYGELFQATNGSFYGMTTEGGQYGPGTVFKLDVGLKPFVRLVTYSGAVGSVQSILGQGFTGTKKVTFDGVSATFTIISDTLLQATVPSAASTGFVKVATPGRVLKSNQKFRVTP